MINDSLPTKKSSPLRFYRDTGLVQKTVVTTKKIKPSAVVGKVAAEATEASGSVAAANN
jgi:hypothetical protein